MASVRLCPARQSHADALCPSNRGQNGHSKKSFHQKSTATPQQAFSQLCKKTCLVSKLLHNKRWHPRPSLPPCWGQR